MKRLLLMVGVVLLAVSAAPAFAAPAGGNAPPAAADLATLQQQIDELRQRLAGLEEQLSATREGQKKTESARATEAKLHKLSGYLQLRYRNDDASAGTDEFLVRRARFIMSGDISPKTGYRIELQADSKVTGGGTGSKVQLRTAYIDQLVGSGRVRFGQAVIPWGYELEASTADLWTGERSFFMDRLFPEQRDIGVQYHWARPGGLGPEIDVAAFNGSGINTSEVDSGRDPMARLKLPFRNGSVAVSYYDGRGEVPITTKDGRRLGAGAEYAWGPWSFLGEYVTGEDRGADVRGWYAQLGARLGQTPSTLFVKFDNYDENTDLSAHDLNRWDLGYFYDLDPRNRLTLVYEHRDVGGLFTSSDRTKLDGNAYWLQWRVKY